MLLIYDSSMFKRLHWIIRQWDNEPMGFHINQEDVIEVLGFSSIANWWRHESNSN
jgi:hypothetical protein